MRPTPKPQALNILSNSYVARRLYSSNIIFCNNCLSISLWATCESKVKSFVLRYRVDFLDTVAGTLSVYRGAFSVFTMTEEIDLTYISDLECFCLCSDILFYVSL